MSDESEAAPRAAVVSEEELDRRLEAMNRIAAALVHEIRNVLNPIVSVAYLLEAHADDPDKVRELAKRIEGFAKAEDRVAMKRRELMEREAASAGGGVVAPPKGSSRIT